VKCTQEKREKTLSKQEIRRLPGNVRTHPFSHISPLPLHAHEGVKKTKQASKEKEEERGEKKRDGSPEQQEEHDLLLRTGGVLPSRSAFFQQNTQENS
jgi:hypothetical protein